MYDLIAKGTIDAAKKTGERKIEALTTLLGLCNIV
jgi:hypothetical protein